MDSLDTRDHAVSQDVERVELAVARLLRLGTAVAATLIASGLVVVLFQLPLAIGPQLVTAGIIALVCTPLLRVAAAMVIYLRLGDVVYGLISLAVLLFVFAGMLIGEGR